MTAVDYQQCACFYAANVLTPLPLAEKTSRVQHAGRFVSALFDLAVVFGVMSPRLLTTSSGSCCCCRFRLIYPGCHRAVFCLVRHPGSHGRKVNTAGFLIVLEGYRIIKERVVPPPSFPARPQEYASKKVRELGLESGEAVDATVLEGRAYPHLDAMRYRLNLLQTLVCATSHVITPGQAEGLWLALVERAVSTAELDSSFQALLGLGREAPEGLAALAGTFFERMCCQGGGPATGNGHCRGVQGGSTTVAAPDLMAVDGEARGGGIRDGGGSTKTTTPDGGSSSNSAAAASTTVSDNACRPTSAQSPVEEEVGQQRTTRRQQQQHFDIHKLRPSGFRFFICCLEVTNLASGCLRPRGPSGGGGGSADSSPEDPGPMPGPMAELEPPEGEAGGDVGEGGGVGSYVVVSMELMGLETLWSIALEVEEEEVSEAAIKKLCEVSCCC